MERLGFRGSRQIRRLLEESRVSCGSSRGHLIVPTLREREKKEQCGVSRGMFIREKTGMRTLVETAIPARLLETD